MSKASAADDRTVSIEVERIVDDLSDPSRPDDMATWEVRPLREDDDFEHYPKYLDGGVPRYWVVTIEGRRMVADLTDSPANRTYFIADMAQEEIAEERREARPWCPVHGKNMMNIRLEEAEVFWQCPDDETIRCDVGQYWTWRKQTRR